MSIRSSATRSMLVWKYKKLRVSYRKELDGWGSELAQHHPPLLRQHYPPKGKSFGTGFEWCAGPAFIGFALLAEGLCDSLVLADINPAAIECIERTVKENGLGGQVRYYLSDNFASIPPTERFDLVVGNPPWYYCINPQHPLYRQMSDEDLRRSDGRWKIHGAFYEQVGNYLNENALLCIVEARALDATVAVPEFPAIPFDLRPRPAIEDWRRQMARGGLTYVQSHELAAHPVVSFVVSRKQPVPRWLSSDRISVAAGCTMVAPLGSIAEKRKVLRVRGTAVEQELALDEDNAMIFDLLAQLSSAASPPTVRALQQSLALPIEEIREALAALHARGWIEPVAI